MPTFNFQPIRLLDPDQCFKFTYLIATVQIQISWLLKKPADLDIHCLQRKGISGLSRIRVKGHRYTLKGDNCQNSEKRLTLKGKTLLPMGANSFISGSAPFQMGVGVQESKQEVTEVNQVYPFILTLCMLGNFCTIFLSSEDFFFFKLTFSKESIRNTFRVSNSLDPDQALCFVGPDLGPNCLQRLSAEDKCRHQGKC